MDITAGPDGNVWFAVRPMFIGSGPGVQRGIIGRITPTGAIREFLLPTVQGAPMLPGWITAGRDGNLWFTGIIAMERTLAHPRRRPLATPVLGRITPTGRISEFPLPTVKNGLDKITTGPDGNLWAAEGNLLRTGGHAIVRINPRLLVSAPVAKCVVPNLKGKTLAQAKKLLGRAHCRLGTVTKPAKHGHTLVVVSQKPAAKRSLPSGSKVSLRLG
jgi:hypothetical protein